MRKFYLLFLMTLFSLFAGAETWVSLGKVKFTEGTLTYRNDNSRTQQEFTVELQQDQDATARYRLVDPYKDFVGTRSGDSYDDSSTHYMVIDAHDPDHVYFETFATGYSGRDGSYTITSEAYYAWQNPENGWTSLTYDQFVTQHGSSYHFGTLENNTITFKGYSSDSQYGTGSTIYTGSTARTDFGYHYPGYADTVISLDIIEDEEEPEPTVTFEPITLDETINLSSYSGGYYSYTATADGTLTYAYYGVTVYCYSDAAMESQLEPSYVGYEAPNTIYSLDVTAGETYYFHLTTSFDAGTITFSFEGEEEEDIYEEIELNTTYTIESMSTYGYYKWTAEEDGVLTVVYSGGQQPTVNLDKEGTQSAGFTYSYVDGHTELIGDVTAGTTYYITQYSSINNPATLTLSFDNGEEPEPTVTFEPITLDEEITLEADSEGYYSYTADAAGTLAIEATNISELYCYSDEEMTTQLTLTEADGKYTLEITEGTTYYFHLTTDSSAGTITFSLEEEEEQPVEVEVGDIIYDDNGVAYEYTGTDAETGINGASIYQQGAEGVNGVTEGDVNIPETFTYKDVTYTVTGIVYDAFYQSNVTSIILPGTITTWSDPISGDGHNQSSGYGIYDCTKLLSVTFGEGITSLPQNAIVFDSGVTGVLATISLPSTLKEIARAFNRCAACTALYVYAETPPELAASTNYIYNGTFNPTVYVPCGTNDAYQKSKAFSSFTIDNYDDCADETVTFEPITIDETIELTADAEGYYSYTATADGTLTFSESGVTVYCYSDEEMTQQIEPTSEDDEAYSIAVTAGATYYFHLVASADAGTITFTFAAEAEEPEGATMVVSPYDGEEVSAISEIIVSCEDGIEWNANSGMYFTVTDKDNQVVAGVWSAFAKVEGYSYSLPLYDDAITDDDVSITLNTPGEYKFTIPASSFYLAGDHTNLNEETTITFTIAEAVEPEPTEYTITFDPEKGGTLTLKSDDSDEWREFSIICEDGIAFSDSGSSHTWMLRDVDDSKSVSLTSFGYKDDDNTAIVGHLASAITTPGTYYLAYTQRGASYTTIPAGTFLLGPESSQVESEEMEYYFTVEFVEAVEPDYTVTFDPDGTQYLTSLSSVTISCEGGIALSETDELEWTIYGPDGEMMEDYSLYCCPLLTGCEGEDGNYTSITFVVKDADGDDAKIVAAGTYTITAELKLTNGETESIKIEYTVDGSEESAEPTTPTLTYEPDLTDDLSNLSTVTITSDVNFSFEESKTITLDITLSDGDETDYTLVASVDENTTSSITFTVMNGEETETIVKAGYYTIIIPAGTFTFANGYEMADTYVTFTIDGTEAPEETGVEITISPSGETEAFDTITITAEGHTDLQYNSDVEYEDIIVVNNSTGETVAYGTEDSDNYDSGTEECTEIYITLDTTVSEPGNYTITVPAGAIQFNNDFSTNAEGISVVTIVATADYTLEFDPPQGEVYELSTITINCEGGIKSVKDGAIDIDLYLEGNTTAVANPYWNSSNSDYETVKDGEGNIISLTMHLLNPLNFVDMTLTELGTYVATIPAGTFTFADDSTNEDITITYTIVEAEEPDPATHTLTFDPEEGVLESGELSTITVTCESGLKAVGTLVAGRGTTAPITKDEETIGYVVYDSTCETVTEGDLIISATMVIHSTNNSEMTITDAGEYTVTFPAKEFTFADGSTSEIITLTYIIEEAEEPVEPITLTIVPADGAKVESISEIVLTAEDRTDLQWNDAVEVSAVVVYGADNKVVAYGASTSDDYNYDDETCTTITVTLDTEITACGDYTISIPESAIYFANDGTPAYSEAATASVYIPISYTFAPTPGEVTDFSEITITFDVPITLAGDITASNCYVTNNSTGTTVATATAYTLSNDGMTLTITLNETPTEAGIYVFHMAAGFTYGSNHSVGDITANYVIADSSFESGVPEGYYVKPDDGSIQESISEIRVYAENGYQMYRDVSVDAVTYVYNESGTAVTTVEWTADYSDKCAIGTLQLTITDPGTYTIHIPNEKIYALSSASSTTKIYLGDFDVVYTIAGNEEGQGQIEWTQVELEKTYEIEEVSTNGYYHYTAEAEGKFILHYQSLNAPHFYSDESMLNELTYSQTETVEGYIGLYVDVQEGDEIYVVISTNAWNSGSLYFTFEETVEYDVTLTRLLPESDTVELANLYNYEVAVTVDGYEAEGYMSFDIICDGADYHTGYFTYLANEEAAAALAEQEGITISVTTFPCYYWQGDSKDEAKYETLVEGNTYSFNVTFRESQSSWSTTFVSDETLFTITGNGEEYVYSSYEFSSIDPAPSDDEENADITSVEQNTFTITFTGPVRIVEDESFVNFGTEGGTYAFESITANGTATTEGEYTYCSSWKLVVSADVMSMLSGDYEGEDLPLVIAAEDADGRRVQGNGSGAYLEELTFLNFTYSTDITDGATSSYTITTTPASGAEVTKIDMITFACEDNIDLNNAPEPITVTIIDAEGVTVAYGSAWSDNGVTGGDDEWTYPTEVYLTIEPTIVTEGNYTITVPAGTFVLGEDGYESKEIDINVYVDGSEDVPAEHTLTFDPENGGEVTVSADEGLTSFTVTCEDGIKATVTGKQRDSFYDLHNTETGDYYRPLTITQTDDYTVTFTWETPITTTGTYAFRTRGLNGEQGLIEGIAKGMFLLGPDEVESPEMQYSFTVVVGDSEPEVTVGSIVYDENHVAYEVLDTNGNVAVAKQKDNEGKTEGAIDIPEDFEYEGNKYYVTAVDYQAFYNDDITSIIFPGTITDWQGSGAQAGYNVYDCTSCETVTFKDGITEIPASCVTFDSTGQSKITTLYLSSTLTTLGSKSFNRLSTLSEVYSYAMTAPTGNSSGSNISFNNSNIGNATLYVYCDAKESYEKSDLWKQFGTIATIDDCGGATETPLTTDPADGDSVESLPYIDVWNPDGTLEFDWDDSPYSETDIVVYKDGDRVGACYDYGYDELYDDATDVHYGYRIYFKDDATSTQKYEFVEAGEYKVSFPGQFFMTDSEGGVNTYVDAFDVTFTVTGKEVTPDYTLTFDPTGEDAVGHLEEVTISSEVGISAEDASDLKWNITKDSEETDYYLTFVSGEENSDGSYSSITLAVTDADGNNVTIVEAGDYTVTIPVDAITYADGTTNTEEITVTYTVDGSESTGGDTGSYTGDVLTPDMSDMGTSSASTWIWTGPSGAEYHLRARLDDNGDFYIQTNSNSWQLWTEQSGGYIRKVTVVGGTNSNGGTLSLYAQHEPYEVYSFNVPKSPSDLGDTLIESHEIDSGQTYEFYVTDNYEYFRLVGTSGAYCTVSLIAAEWETPYEVAEGDIVHDDQGVAYKVQDDLESVYIAKQTADDGSYEGQTEGALTIGETIEAKEDGKTYNVTGAETNAFKGASITSIELPGTLAKFGSGSTFYGCTSLESVTLHEGIPYIAGSMFYGCSALTEINVPEGVTYVDSHAFNGCSSLTTVYLPSTISEGEYDDETIGGSAFANCSKLAEFTILAETPPYVGNKAFDSSIISNATLYVPCDYVDAYVSYSGEYTGWESFGAIVGLNCPELDYTLTFDPSGENGIGHLSEVVVTTTDVAISADAAADLKWEIIDTESPNAEYYLSFVSGVKDADGNYSSITLAVTDADGKTTQITEAGEYTITIKAGDITFSDGTTNAEDITLTYTVNGTEWRDTDTYNSLCADLTELLEKLEAAYEYAQELETDDTVKELYTSIKSEIEELQTTLDADYEAGNTLDADEYNKKIEAIDAEIDHLSAVAYSEYIYYQYASDITEVWGMVGDYVDWELEEMGDDVYKEFIDDFEALDSEITSWRSGLISAAANGELTDDDKADIEEKLAEYQKAADLLVNKAESYTYYTETTAAISDLAETLDTTWAEIQTTYPDAVDLLTNEKEEIAEAITDLQTSLTTSYEAGTLNDEDAQATIDAEIAAIEEAIDNLLNKAHNYEVYVEEEAAADETSDMLEDTWSEIADLYPDAIDEFEDDYNAIVSAIQALKDQIESNYNDGTILDMEETYAEEIAEIEDMINSLLTRAHLYQVYVDDEAEADSTADLLDSTWEEIRDTYGDGAIGALQEDYDDIVSSIDDLKTEIENYYNDGTILDKSDDIAAEIEAIKDAIDQLLENASKYGATGIYSIYSDYEGMDVYTLNGQKINAPTKRGIYIINGKKVYVK